jgi:signal transduction histidine kinase
MDLKESDVPVPLKTTLFRILQEAMNNIAKHAKADLVQVSLNRGDGRISLEIRDNGRGFSLTAAERTAMGTSGFGLTSMKDRALLSGGTYAIESVKGRGTTIRASWPAS